MAIKISTILQWFKAGQKPTEQQFADSWQSFWHKDETIPQISVEHLEATFGSKASQEELEAHINDPHAHDGGAIPSLQQVNSEGNSIIGESFWTDESIMHSAGVHPEGFFGKNNNIRTNIIFDNFTDNNGTGEKKYHIDGTKEDGDIFAMVSDTANRIPYIGATDDVDLGIDHRLGAGYVGGGYGDGTTVPAYLAARNPVIPPAGATATVFSVYNSEGEKGLYTYVDDRNTMYANNMGKGNIPSNTVFGQNVLASNTTGYENTAVGVSALSENTEGRSNMAFGSYTLANNTVGTRNTAMGAQALYSNTTANFNVGVGHQTMRNNQSTEHNVAIGYSAGQYTTGGTGENVYVGAEAARSLVNSTKSVFIGRQAGINQSTSSGASIGNTAIGYQTMALSWNTDLLYNTAVGHQALRNIKSGSYNSFFGAWTGSSSTENQILGSYNTIIGSQVILTSAEKAASNQVILSDGQGNRVLFKESSGNVNITGHTYPASHSAYDFGGASLRWKNLYGATGNFESLVITNIPQSSNTGTTWLTRNASSGVIESALPGYALATGMTTTATSAAPTATSDIVTNLSRIYGNLLTLRTYGGKTADYMLNATDATIDFTGATNATATLITAVGNAGKRFTIKNSGTGIVSVVTTSSQTIDGATTFMLSLPYTTLTVQSDGANWKIISVYGFQGEGTLKKSTSYTITGADYRNGGLTVFADASLSAVTITLEDSASMAGKTVHIIKADPSANQVTVKGNGTTHINSTPYVVLSTPYKSVTLKSDSTQYYAL